MKRCLIDRQPRQVSSFLWLIVLCHVLAAAINGQQGSTWWTMSKPSEGAQGFYFLARDEADSSLTSAHQQPPIESVYYSKSWKKGTRLVQEEKIDIELDTKNRTYQTDIKDASGKARYKLRVEPTLTDNHDSSIGAWAVRLIGMGDPFSLLAAHNQPHQHDFTIEDYLDLLYPVENADWRKTGFFGVPLSAKRVIKVEGFYCIIQVKSYHLNSAKPRALDWIKLEIQFTNNYEPKPSS